jgi:hypothetical protein
VIVDVVASGQSPEPIAISVALEAVETLDRPCAGVWLGTGFQKDYWGTAKLLILWSESAEI